MSSLTLAPEQCEAPREAVLPDFDKQFREPRTNGASLTLRGLSKRFGQRTILRDIDLHVPAGQFVAIIGRSGCGKST